MRKLTSVTSYARGAEEQKRRSHDFTDGGRDQTVATESLGRKTTRLRSSSEQPHRLVHGSPGCANERAGYSHDGQGRPDARGIREAAVDMSRRTSEQLNGEHIAEHLRFLESTVSESILKDGWTTTCVNLQRLQRDLVLFRRQSEGQQHLEMWAQLQRRIDNINRLLRGFESSTVEVERDTMSSRNAFERTERTTNSRVSENQPRRCRRDGALRRCACCCSVLLSTSSIEELETYERHVCVAGGINDRMSTGYGGNPPFNQRDHVDLLRHLMEVGDADQSSENSRLCLGNQSEMQSNKVCDSFSSIDKRFENRLPIHLDNFNAPRISHNAADHTVSRPCSSSSLVPNSESSKVVLYDPEELEIQQTGLTSFTGSTKSPRVEERLSATLPRLSSDERWGMEIWSSDEMSIDQLNQRGSNSTVIGNRRQSNPPVLSQPRSQQVRLDSSRHSTTGAREDVNQPDDLLGGALDEQWRILARTIFRDVKEWFTALLPETSRVDPLTASTTKSDVRRPASTRIEDNGDSTWSQAVSSQRIYPAEVGPKLEDETPTPQSDRYQLFDELSNLPRRTKYQSADTTSQTVTNMGYREGRQSTRSSSPDDESEEDTVEVRARRPISKNMKSCSDGQIKRSIIKTGTFTPGVSLATNPVVRHPQRRRREEALDLSAYQQPRPHSSGHHDGDTATEISQTNSHYNPAKFEPDCIERDTIVHGGDDYDEDYPPSSQKYRKEFDVQLFTSDGDDNVADVYEVTSAQSGRISTLSSNDRCSDRIETNEMYNNPPAKQCRTSSPSSMRSIDVRSTSKCEQEYEQNINSNDSLHSAARSPPHLFQLRMMSIRSRVDESDESERSTNDLQLWREISRQRQEQLRFEETMHRRTSEMGTQPRFPHNDRSTPSQLQHARAQNSESRDGRTHDEDESVSSSGRRRLSHSEALLDGGCVRHPRSPFQQSTISQHGRKSTLHAESSNQSLCTGKHLERASVFSDDGPQKNVRHQQSWDSIDSEVQIRRSALQPISTYRDFKLLQKILDDERKQYDVMRIYPAAEISVISHRP